MRLRVLLLLGLLVPMPALALVRPEPLALPHLADEASVITSARITAQRVVWNETHDLLFTEYTAVPLRSWKGALAGAVTFRIPGGELDGLGLVVPGMPRVAAGQPYLLALKPSAEHALELVAPGVGVWPVRGETIEGLGLTLDQLADALVGRRAAAPAICPLSCVPPLETQAGLPLRWPSATPMGESFLINPAPPLGCATSDDWVAAVRTAAAEWNDVRLGFCYDEGGTTGLGSKGKQPDGFNVVHVGNAHGALAVTTVWYDPPTGNIVENDMVVDTGRKFSWGCVTSGAIGATQYDLLATVLHEFGHFLALEDVYDPGCEALTMFGIGFRGDIAPRTLEPEDVCGAQALYGDRDLHCSLLAFESEPTEQPEVQNTDAAAQPDDLSGLMTAGPGAVRFTLRRAGKVSAGVYDLAGRLVYSFPTLWLEAGTHTLRWGGQLGEGDAQRGIYFVRVKLQGGPASARKVVWTR
jgi:hypothetical protein